VGWIYGELVLIALAAMLSPTTLTFSVFALVLGRRPLRTGLLFYSGALGATLAVGIVGAFVIGDLAASSHPSTPKTWVAVVDMVAALAIAAWVIHVYRAPRSTARTERAIDQMSRVATSRAIAVVGAGAVLANPGGFIPLALKSISETDPSTAAYAADWLFFAVVSLLPLLAAIVMLVVSRRTADRALQASRSWLERHARTVAAGIVLLLAASLLRNGIAGLTG
jgi:Sap, sulfolipid-1-addressing protein